MLTDVSIPALEVWRLYRGRADCVDLGFCQNRIKELKAAFGLDSFVLRDFWATEAAVGALWDDNSKNTKQTFRLAVARKRRP